MIKYTHNRNKRLYGAVLSLLFAFILVFSIGFGAFGEKRVEASNPYISNIEFYRDGDGFLRLKFFVNTSFCARTPFYWDYAGNIDYGIGLYPLMLSDNDCSTSILKDEDCFTAGNTYTLFICSIPNKISASPTSSNYIENIGWYNYPGGTCEGARCIFTPTWYDTEKYYFTETPTLNITFPLPNAEIAEAFYITGTYTIPSLDDYNLLFFGFYRVDLGVVYFYKTYLTETSGSFSVRVAGIPTENYIIKSSFYGAIGEYYIPDEIPISIVDAIPVELPDTQEAPPEFFGVVRGDEFYPAHSNYPDPTNFYSNLIGAVEPVIIVIGENLTFFSSKFNQDVAQATGTKTGEAVLLMRAYSSNLNTFFSDLPVSEFLFFYLTLLIVVVVFRLVKNLINIVKP